VLIKNLKNEKYEIESVGEYGKVAVVVGDGLVKIEEAPFVIDTAGEYEIKGIHIYGINGGKGKTPIFLIITQEKIKAAYMGALKENLSQEQVDELSDTDILLSFLTDANAKAVEQIEPNILIPIAYTEELLQKYFPGAVPKKMDKLTIKSKDVLTEDMEIITL